MTPETLETSANWVQNYAQVQEIWMLMLWKQRVAREILSGSMENSEDFGKICDAIKKLMGIE